MINQIFVGKLINLIKQGVLSVKDIKIQEYRVAVESIINRTAEDIIE